MPLVGEADQVAVDAAAAVAAAAGGGGGGNGAAGAAGANDGAGDDGEFCPPVGGPGAPIPIDSYHGPAEIDGVCQYYKHSQCEYGAACRFKHIGEAADPLSNVCGHYLRGKCTFRKKCSFPHPPGMRGILATRLPGGGGPRSKTGRQLEERSRQSTAPPTPGIGAGSGTIPQSTMQQLPMAGGLGRGVPPPEGLPGALPLDFPVEHLQQQLLMNAQVLPQHPQQPQAIIMPSTLDPYAALHAQHDGSVHRQALPAAAPLGMLPDAAGASGVMQAAQHVLAAGEQRAAAAAPLPMPQHLQPPPPGALTATALPLHESHYGAAAPQPYPLTGFQQQVASAVHTVAAPPAIVHPSIPPGMEALRATDTPRDAVAAYIQHPQPPQQPLDPSYDRRQSANAGSAIPQPPATPAMSSGPTCPSPAAGLATPSQHPAQSTSLLTPHHAAAPPHPAPVTPCRLPPSAAAPQPPPAPGGAPNAEMCAEGIRRAMESALDAIAREGAPQPEPPQPAPEATFKLGQMVRAARPLYDGQIVCGTAGFIANVSADGCVTACFMPQGVQAPLMVDLHPGDSAAMDDDATSMVTKLLSAKSDEQAAQDEQVALTREIDGLKDDNKRLKETLADTLLSAEISRAKSEAECTGLLKQQQELLAEQEELVQSIGIWREEGEALAKQVAQLQQDVASDDAVITGVTQRAKNAGVPIDNLQPLISEYARVNPNAAN